MRKITVRLGLCGALLLLHISCLSQKPFGPAEQISSVNKEQIPEASGIAASVAHPGLLWVHNDSGDKPRLFLIDPKTGEIKSTLFLSGIENRDWEDLCTGPGPDGTPHIFVGEIGDNRRVYDSKHIYYFPEPKQYNTVDSVSEFGTYSFNFPDQNRDSEALAVDPRTRDIWLFSKWEPRVTVYRIPFLDGNYGDVEEIGKIGFTLVVAADFARNGNEMLLKTYEYMFYFKKEEGQNWGDVLKGSSVNLPYKVEKQGESVAWEYTDAGYYTLSEQIPDLYYYPRSAE